MGLIEVYDPEKHAFFPAQVIDVTGDSCDCKFLVDGVRRKVESEFVRLVPDTPQAESYAPRQDVEVCCQSNTEPGGDHELGQCWWEAQILALKGEFCHVSYKNWDKSYDEIVEIEYIRPASGLPAQALRFEKHDIPLPAKLREWAKDLANLEELKNKSQAWGLSLQESKKSTKLCLLGTKNSAEMAKMLLTLHSKHQDGLRQLESEASKLQIEKEKRQEQYGNSVHAMFDVEDQLIGAIVGQKGSHINAAIKESGVHSAYVDNGKVIIHGPDQESVDACREMLELVREQVEVDESMLGWVIGKRGANIREMEQETGVISIRVVGTQVEFIGTKFAVMKGKLWLEEHTTYVDPMNDARQAVNDRYQELQAEEQYNWTKGSGGKGRGKGKGKGKGDRRDGKGGRGGRQGGGERVVEAMKPVGRGFEQEDGDFPDLPMPNPASPKEDDQSNKQSKPKPKGKKGGAPGEGAVEEARVPKNGRGRGRGGKGDRGGRGRGKGGSKDAKDAAPPKPAPKVEKAKPKDEKAGADSNNNSNAKPQRNRNRKNQSDE